MNKSRLAFAKSNVRRFFNYWYSLAKQSRGTILRAFICSRAKGVLQSLTLLLVAFGVVTAIAKMPDFYKEPGVNPNRDYVNHHVVNRGLK
jgi:hypothetical protein